MKTLSEQMSSKSDQEIIQRATEKEFEELKEDIQSLGKKDFAVLKGELDKIIADLDRLKTASRDDISRAHGGVRLDINLEKARIKDESVGLEFRI